MKTTDSIRRKKDLRATLAVLKKYILLFRRQIIVVTVFSVISAIGSGFVPYIIGRFFDAITQPGMFAFMGVVMPLFAALLALWSAVQIILSYVNWRISNISSELGYRARFQYASEIYSHLIELPMHFHKTHKFGEIDSKIVRASGSLETIFSQVLINLAPQFASIIIALVIVCFINWQLSILLVIGVIVYVVIALRSVAKAGDLLSAGHDMWNESYGYAYDTVQNVLAVKQFTTEAHEKKTIYERFNVKLFKMWMAIDGLWDNLRYYQQIIVIVCQIVIFIVSVVLIREGRISIGDLIALNAYASMIFGPFVTLMNNWQVIQNGITNIGRNDDIFSTPTEAYSPEKQPDISAIYGDVEFDGVSFRYDDERTVLSDISFKVGRGDIVAIVGESGVGKSTLVDLISGLHFPASGVIRVDGHDIRTLNLTMLRSNVAVVPQEVVLFNDTIRNNIAYGNFGANQEALDMAAREAHAFDFIEKFPKKWDQLVGERGVKLSVGQKQRVAIARAILRNPKILILDEPTSALDAGSEHIITESLEKLMEGRTTFIIAHRLSTVRHADIILVFKDGRIVEQGKHRELLKIKGGEYRRLYELQIGLHQ